MKFPDEILFKVWRERWLKLKIRHIQYNLLIIFLVPKAKKKNSSIDQGFPPKDINVIS